MNYYSHPTAVIDENCIIGEGTRIWHFSHIMPGCSIGKNCNLGQNVVVSPGVILGNNVKVQNNVSIYTGVECGDDVFLGPSMVFTNVINPRSAIIRKDQYRKTLVKKGASIGANATIICGNEIGEYAMMMRARAYVRSPDYWRALWSLQKGVKIALDKAGILSAGNRQAPIVRNEPLSAVNRPAPEEKPTEAEEADRTTGRLRA